MARKYRRWIFTKSTEYRPNGVLQVGQILAQPFEPASALHPAGPPGIPDGIMQEDSALEDVTTSQANEMSLHFGLSADLAGMAPVGSSTSAAGNKAQSQERKIDKIISKIITPSNSYVDVCLRDGDVPVKLKNKWRYKQRLYMITGTRVVQGARMVSTGHQSFEGKAKTEVDGKSLGVPINLGTSGGIQNKNSQELKFGGATDFVFAYRLQEILYYGIKSTKHHPFNKGETSGVDSPAAAQEIQDEHDDFKVFKIKGEDFGEDLDGIQAEAISEV